MLRALDVPVSVYHLNEGHCSFVALELLRERIAAGASKIDAEEAVRACTVFTTHTPVPAGHDRFDVALFESTLSAFAGAFGWPIADLLAYGQETAGGFDLFNMTVLGLRLSRSANGVSKLNGEVARAQWLGLYPGLSVDEVPIGHVTNGIHIPTWIAPAARKLVEEQCGPLDTRRSETSYWEPLRSLEDEAIWELRTRLRRDLVAFAYDRVSRGTLPQAFGLDPEALTIGFARRLAPYKRAILIFSDLERAARIFGDIDRPVQIIFAGKSHPNNDIGKSFIRQIIEVGRLPAFSGRIVFLENYDMEVGRMLVSGCDVWLNNPRRPMEASGTSGQKIAVHGGLNLSILDGWWPEGYNTRNGWAIGSRSDSAVSLPEEQDPIDADHLYGVLENEVLPTFFDRDERGVPRGWIERVREAMTGLPPQFSATRMVRQYADSIYAKDLAEVETQG
jgi:starch phosphorylase/maltose phosphorylase